VIPSLRLGLLSLAGRRFATLKGIVALKSFGVLALTFSFLKFREWKVVCLLSIASKPWSFSGESLKVVNDLKALKRKGYPKNLIKTPYSAIVRASLEVKP